TSSEQRFLSAIQDFARRADRFHSRMDNYQTSPWDVDSEVRVLLRQARSVNGRLRSAHAFEETYDNWNDVLDVLGRMRRVMAGQHTPASRTTTVTTLPSAMAPACSTPREAPMSCG